MCRNCIDDVMEAYVDILMRVKASPEIRAAIAALEGMNKAQLINTSAGLFATESWWYLVFKTCDAEGAILIASFCKNWKDPWDKLKVKKLCDEFQEHIKELPNWWEGESSNVAIGDFGPWIPEGV